jgi:hypothetical protein
MAEDKELIAIAFKADLQKKYLVDKLAGLAEVHDFPVPADALRVGTLDSLMSLSDDIAKMDTLAEGACFKFYRQYTELKGGQAPTVNGSELRPRLGSSPFAAQGRRRRAGVSGACLCAGRRRRSEEDPPFPRSPLTGTPLAWPSDLPRPDASAQLARLPTACPPSSLRCSRYPHVCDQAMGLGRGQVPTQDSVARARRNHQRGEAAPAPCFCHAGGTMPAAAPSRNGGRAHGVHICQHTGARRSARLLSPPPPPEAAALHNTSVP